MDEEYLDHSASEWGNEPDGRTVDSQGRVPFEFYVDKIDFRSRLDDMDGDFLPPRLGLKHFIPFYGPILHRRDVESSGFLILKKIKKRYTAGSRLEEMLGKGNARLMANITVLKVTNITYAIGIGTGLCYLFLKAFN